VSATWLGLGRGWAGVGSLGTVAPKPFDASPKSPNLSGPSLELSVGLADTASGFGWPGRPVPLGLFPVLPQPSQNQSGEYDALQARSLVWFDLVLRQETWRRSLLTVKRNPRFRFRDGQRVS